MFWCSQVEAAKYDLNYIGLSGNIGCMGKSRSDASMYSRNITGRGRKREWEVGCSSCGPKVFCRLVRFDICLAENFHGVQERDNKETPSDCG